MSHIRQGVIIKSFRKILIDWNLKLTKEEESNSNTQVISIIILQKSITVQTTRPKEEISAQKNQIHFHS